MSKKDARTIEMSLEIAASPEAVWRALTDAKELARWFPLNADIEPRVGQGNSSVMRRSYGR
jgi:uncharacterized protein YndB with AHSA1/START domain